MSPKNPSKPKRKRRKFTPEFKAEAVRIVRTSGKSVGEVARELDLTETCLRTWVLQAQVDEKQDPQGALTTDERAELMGLRRSCAPSSRSVTSWRRTSRRASREVRGHHGLLR